MEEERFYQHIQEALENIPENYTVLEEQIDIGIQMKYFNFAKKVRKKDIQDECFENREELFQKGTKIGRKREILTVLATVDDVKAYRTLEKFVKESKGPIQQWAILAMQENRMLLQSSLLDEQQIFISTGLGGKGQMLRYYVVFINRDREKALNEIQQKLLRDELIFKLKERGGEFESMDFMEGFSTSLVLLPLRVEIRNVFREVIDECNQYGDFLREDMIVTNVKILSRGEIVQMLESDKKSFRDELEEP